MKHCHIIIYHETIASVQNDDFKKIKWTDIKELMQSLLKFLKGVKIESLIYVDGEQVTVCFPLQVNKKKLTLTIFLNLKCNRDLFA